MFIIDVIKKMILKIIGYTIVALVVAFLSFNIFFINMYELFEFGREDIVQDEGCFAKDDGIYGAEDQTRWNDKALISSQVDLFGAFKSPDTHTNFGSIWVFSGDF